MRQYLLTSDRWFSVWANALACFPAHNGVGMWGKEGRWRCINNVYFRIVLSGFLIHHTILILFLLHEAHFGFNRPLTLTIPPNFESFLPCLWAEPLLWFGFTSFTLLTPICPVFSLICFLLFCFKLPRKSKLFLLRAQHIDY